jgi:hypothetical protein
MNEKIGDQIPPTPLRIGADKRFVGHVVTIALLVSGFYLHPDSTQSTNRVACNINIAAEALPEAAVESEYRTADPASWYCTVTSVVATGNGCLSGGCYCSVATEGHGALANVCWKDGVHRENIRRGLEWVLGHRRQ